MLVGTERIDYVKVLFPRDSELGYDDNLQRLRRKAQLATFDVPSSRKAWDFSVLGGATGRDANMCLEIWGEPADAFARALTAAEWFHVVRLDLRQEYSIGDERDFRHMAVGAIRKGSSRVNMMVLDSKPRTKSNTRDIGGQGVQYGSRKSNRQIVCYKRGTDNPAIEKRILAQDCQAIVRGVLKDWKPEQNHTRTLYDVICQDASLEMDRWAVKVLGTCDYDAWLYKTIDAEAEAVEHLTALEANKAVANGQREFWNMLASQQPELSGAYDFPPCVECGAAYGRCLCPGADMGR